MKWAISKISAPIVTCMIFLIAGQIFGQITKFENKVPKSVPLEVEFKNFDKENWWRDFELKVTNTGKRPIYYLTLRLWFDSNYPQNIGPGSGKELVLTFSFGDTRRFFSDSNGELGRAEDSAILAGETYAFRVRDADIKAWDYFKEHGNFVEPRVATLTHAWTNFGDGTGLLPGGTPWRFTKNMEDSRK